MPLLQLLLLLLVFLLYQVMVMLTLLHNCCLFDNAIGKRIFFPKALCANVV